MATLVTTSPISTETRVEVRAKAREAAGLAGRGRTPKAVILAFLNTRPATVRALAAEAGVEVPAKGRFPQGVKEQIAALV